MNIVLSSHCVIYVDILTSECDKHFQNVTNISKHYTPHYNDQFPNVAIVKDDSTLCQVFPNIAL